MGETLEESLSGISVVKAFSHQEEDFRKFDKQAEELYNEQMRAARMLSFNMPTMIFLVSVPTVMILWFGSRLHRPPVPAVLAPVPAWRGGLGMPSRTGRAPWQAVCPAGMHRLAGDPVPDHRRPR